jgi:hypothetical protein
MKHLLHLFIALIITSITTNVNAQVIVMELQNIMEVDCKVKTADDIEKAGKIRVPVYVTKREKMIDYKLQNNLYLSIDGSFKKYKPKEIKEVSFKYEGDDYILKSFNRPNAKNLLWLYFIPVYYYKSLFAIKKNKDDFIYRKNIPSIPFFRMGGLNGFSMTNLFIKRTVKSN